MKIGVTGASGQLGRLVISELKKITDSQNIIALARDVNKVQDLGVETRKFDYSKAENIAESLKGIDRLLLISGSEVGQRVPQHKNVIEGAKKAGIELVAYTSGLNIEQYLLGEEHLQTEKILKESGLNYLILRHGWYAENLTQTLWQDMERGAIFGAEGKGKYSVASREDFARADAFFITSDQKNKTINLAGDTTFTMEEFTEEISRQTGKNVVYKKVSSAEYEQVLQQAGFPEIGAKIFADVHRAVENGALENHENNISKFTGKPTISLSEMIKKAL